MYANVEAKAGGKVGTKMGVNSDTTKVDALSRCKKRHKYGCKMGCKKV